jgi:hypothetical protein
MGLGLFSSFLHEKKRNSIPQKREALVAKFDFISGWFYEMAW